MSKLIPPAISLPVVEEQLRLIDKKLEEIAARQIFISSPNIDGSLKRVLEKMPPLISLPVVEERLGLINEKLETISAKPIVISSPAIESSLKSLLEKRPMAGNLFRLLCAVVISVPLWYIVLKKEPEPPMRKESIVLCQSNLSPLFKSIEFVGPTFKSGDIHFENNLPFKGNNNQLLKDLVKKPHKWQILYWEVQAGHDVDKLGMRARQKYDSNLDLAIKRANSVRQHLDEMTKNSNWQAPIRISLRTNEYVDQDIQTKAEDRKPRIIVYYYDETNQRGARVISCQEFAGNKSSTQ